jgi:hypothetical protein
MIRTLIASIAALLLATGTAHAEDGKDQWVPDYRRGHVSKEIPVFIDGVWRRGRAELELEDLEELQKFIVSFRRMGKFWKCVSEREPGRPKHCYLPKGKLYGEDRE